MFMQMSYSASWVCTAALKMGILSIFAEIVPTLLHFNDFKCIFHDERNPALVTLFQHINKDGNLSCSK